MQCAQKNTRQSDESSFDYAISITQIIKKQIKYALKFDNEKAATKHFMPIAAFSYGIRKANN